MEKFIFALLLLFPFASFAQDSSEQACPEIIDVEVIDINKDNNEPITLRFGLPPYKYKYGCEFTQYIFESAFIGRTDDYFDNIDVVQLNEDQKSWFTFVKHDLKILEHFPAAIYTLESKNLIVGKTIKLGRRHFLEILVPYKIVVSEGRLYLDLSNAVNRFNKRPAGSQP